MFEYMKQGVPGTQTSDLENAHRSGWWYGDCHETVLKHGFEHKMALVA